MSEQKSISPLPPDFYTKELTPEQIAELEREAGETNTEAIPEADQVSLLPDDIDVPDLDIEGFLERTVGSVPPNREKI